MKFTFSEKEKKMVSKSSLREMGKNILKKRKRTTVHPITKPLGVVSDRASIILLRTLKKISSHIR